MANEPDVPVRRPVALYWAATVPAWGVVVAWLMGWVGRASLAGPERSRQCDGTLLPAGTDFRVVLLWALPVVFGIATGALLLLLWKRCGDVRHGRQAWYSPVLLVHVFVLAGLAWIQVMATQRAVGDLVALFPHSQVCGADMAGIDILFGPVAQASVDLEIIALDAKKNIDTELAKNSVAADGLAGFDSAAALRSCAESWNAHLVQLVRDTLDASLRLASTVGDYQDLERRLAGALDAMDTGR